eukprot:366573-Chlamydomonas_euryale.AAC.6
MQVAESTALSVRTTHTQNREQHPTNLSPLCTLQPDTSQALASRNRRRNGTVAFEVACVTASPMIIHSRRQGRERERHQAGYSSSKFAELRDRRHVNGGAANIKMSAQRGCVGSTHHHVCESSSTWLQAG